MIATSSYHIARTKIIFNTIYGDAFRLYFCGVQGFSSENKIAHEEDSLGQFYLTFNRVPKNNNDLYNCLRNRHPFYNGEVYPKIAKYENFISRSKK